MERYISCEVKFEHVLLTHPVDLIPSYALPYARVRESEVTRKGEPRWGKCIHAVMAAANRGMLRTDGALAILFVRLFPFVERKSGIRKERRKSQSQSQTFQDS